MRWLFPYTPEPKVLEAIGRVAIRHAYLDRMLRMTIKSLTGVGLRDSLASTKRKPSSSLRESTRKAAKSVGLSGAAALQLDTLLERAESASGQRNHIIHSVYGAIYDDEQLPDEVFVAANAALLTEDEQVERLPTYDELCALASEIKSIADDLNEARRFGPIAKALKAAGDSPSGDNPAST